MGQSPSYPYPPSKSPPPLVEVLAPGGKVLVPPNTTFGVYPPGRRVPPRGTGMGMGYDIYEEDDGLNESEMSIGGVGVGVMPGRRGGAYARGGGEIGMGLGGGRRGSAPFIRGGAGGYGSMGSPRMGPSGLGGPGGLGPMGGMNGLGMGMGMAPPGVQGFANPMAHHAMMPTSPDLPPGYSSMQHLPPRYSAGGGPMPPMGSGQVPGPGQNPYTSPYPYEASQGSSASSSPRRHRSPSANKNIPLGAFAKSHSPGTPKMRRAHTSPTARVNVKTGGENEWIKGDSFLDACICTPNCTCREGHRVLYRSRDDGGSGDEGEGQYGQGEIRYILKKDLGRDCGDHSACVKKGEQVGSDEEVVISRGGSKKREKEKKKEEKKRKEEMEGFKEDLLEALDEKFEKMRKRGGGSRGSRSSKAGSIGSPRLPFAGMGGTFPGMNMGVGNPAAGGPAGLDPRLADMMGGIPGMGMGTGMPPAFTPGNPHAAMNMPGQSMAQRQPGLPDPMAGARPLRPGQMPMAGMPFEDDISIADMEALNMGNPYLNPGLKSKGLQSRFLSPDARGPSGMDREKVAFYGNPMRGSQRPPRYPGGRTNRRQPLPRGGGGGGSRDYSRSEDFSPGPRRADLGKRDSGKGRQDSFDDMADLRNNDDDRLNGARSSRDRDQGRHHPRVETDDDDAY